MLAAAVAGISVPQVLLCQARPHLALNEFHLQMLSHAKKCILLVAGGFYRRDFAAQVENVLIIGQNSSASKV